METVHPLLPLGVLASLGQNDLRFRGPPRGHRRKALMTIPIAIGASQGHDEVRHAVTAERH